MKKPIKVRLSLLGLNGNAFSLMAQFERAARKQGFAQADVQEVLDECKKGDYDHLLQTLIKHTLEDGENEQDDE